MIGQTLSHYRITAALGAGGMGEVYRATDTNLDREVAIKVLPAEVAGDTERLERFRREAHLLAALNHPNIAAIHGLEEADGTPFLVLELVEGQDLKDRLEKSAIPVDEALEIAERIAAALEEAHNKGIVHRDLKPANVMLTPDGKVKVLDFGLAKAWADETDGGTSSASMSQSPTLAHTGTAAGIILGTAAYMSPEQARGKSVDRRADVWSFGVLLWEMLTGRTLFAGETVTDVIAAVVTREPDLEALPAETPQNARRLISRCLRKDPRRRLPDVGGARLELQDLLAGTETEAAGTSGEGVVGDDRRPRTRELSAWILVAVLAAGLGVSLVALAPWTAPPPPSATRAALAPPADAGRFGDSELGLALSPDGSHLAFAMDVEDGRALYVRRLDRWESTRLVFGVGDDAPYDPFFSPDGEWLGFVTNEELKKVPVTGGTPITLCRVNQPGGASWGDGFIVLAPIQSGGLSRVSAAGGVLEPLTTLHREAAETTHRWPQVLPGGKAVLFTSHTIYGRGFYDATIELLVLATGERRVLHRGGTFPRYAESGHVVFARDGRLLALPFSLERLEATGPAAPVVEEVRSSAVDGRAQFSVSSDGSLVYLAGSSGARGYAVVWVDRDGRHRPLWEDRRLYANPQLSPDGTRLAVDVLEGEQRDIWVYELEARAPTRLTFGDADDAHPIWSPDGTSIAFASDRHGGQRNIYRMSADGVGEVERLTRSENQQSPSSWSRDGRLLVYTEVDPETSVDLWLLPLDGQEEPRQLLATPFVEYGADLSPDGRFITYGSNESGTWEIYVRAVTGQGQWQISDDAGGFPLWSRTGREIVYIRNGRIKAVPVESAGQAFRAGPPEYLFREAFLNLSGWRYHGVDPRGDRFVMFKATEESSLKGHERLQLVRHWFSELRKP